MQEKEPSENDGGEETVGLFADYLRALEAGQPLDFELLCNEHPERAAELRRLEANYRELHDALGDALGDVLPSASIPATPPGSGAPSLGARLASRYGADIDPSITLEAESEADAAFASEVLGRLSDRDSTRYRLKGEVGKGGMGAVLRVWDEDLRRHLAMKVILGKTEELASGDTPPVDSKLLARFLEEAQVTGQLDHPGIVPVHELGLDEAGQVYFTMKLVKGRTLGEVIDMAHADVPEKQEGWSRTRVLEVILKICDAMAYAHDKGVIHRDLKPANVMVGRFGAVYVMDWGLARILGRPDRKDVRIQDLELPTSSLRSVRQDEADSKLDSPLLTMDGDVVGTPAYMSPEQADGRVEELGPPSDVYAVGAILYHALSGHMPYVKPGSQANNYAIWNWVRGGPPESLSSRAPDAPVELVSICEKAMAREIGARYANMAELSEDLRAFLEGRVVGAYETGSWAETRKWVKRNKGLAASLAAVVVALVAGLAVALVLRQEALDNEVLASQNADRADEQKRLADEQRDLADERAAEAARKRDEVLQLSALQDVEDLLVEVEGLWPAWPEQIESFDEWMAAARELTAKLTAHRAKRAELRAKALPRSEEQRTRERESHPRFGELEVLEGELRSRRRALARRRDTTEAAAREVDWASYPDDASALNTQAWELVKPDRERFGDEDLGLALAQRASERAEGELVATTGDTLAWAWFALGEDDRALDTMFAALDALGEEAGEEKRVEFEGYLAKLEAAVEVATGDEALAQEAERIAALEAERAELDARVDGRRDWRFPAGEDEARWWNNQLTKLIDELEGLERDLLDPEAVTETHGWSVAKRRAFAEGLRAGFAPGGVHATLWERSLPALRAAYPELELTPQMGLVPLGADPVSGLWEFGELATGTPPVRDGEGQLVFEEDSGLVFVLLPGGTFSMGSQKADPIAGDNYDRDGSGNEGPVHEVELSAFFLSKYEMTQAQWERVTGRNPSRYPPGGLSVKPTNPVEQVNWWTCTSTMQRMRLSLPSEAQWEYAARGGTTTPWWTGAERESLRAQKAANLADQAAARAGATWQAIQAWPELDDGWVVHAPVDSFAPNAFGLHHVHGNVWEWCADGFSSYTANRVVDPFVEPAGSSDRVPRGGGFNVTAVYARSANRNSTQPVYASLNLGLRPARALRAP